MPTVEHYTFDSITDVVSHFAYKIGCLSTFRNIDWAIAEQHLSNVATIEMSGPYKHILLTDRLIKRMDRLEKILPIDRFGKKDFTKWLTRKKKISCFGGMATLSFPASWGEFGLAGNHDTAFIKFSDKAFGIQQERNETFVRRVSAELNIKWYDEASYPQPWENPHITKWFGAANVIDLAEHEKFGRDYAE